MIAFFDLFLCKRGGVQIPVANVSAILMEQEILEARVSFPPFTSVKFNPQHIHTKWRRHWKPNGQGN